MTIKLLEPDIKKLEALRDVGSESDKQNTRVKLGAKNREIAAAKNTLDRIGRQSPDHENVTQAFEDHVTNTRLSFTIYQYVGDVEDKVPVAVYRGQLN